MTMLMAILTLPYNLGYLIHNMSENVFNHIILYLLSLAGVGVLLMVLGGVPGIASSIMRFNSQTQPVKDRGLS